MKISSLVVMTGLLFLFAGKAYANAACRGAGN